ncbi:MAG TPA: hypothetical protein ENJ32_06585 [Crenotrichaceae bacterium]|nr:hypothetical protein [Crenotrichaceae bacterium]
MNINADMYKQILYSPIILSIIIASLVGCDSGNNAKTSIISKAPVQKYEKTVTIKGVVRGEKGLIKAGKIKATSQTKVIATAEIEKNGRYTIHIPPKTQFPVLISAYPGDASKQKVLSVALVNAMLTNHDITPSSTQIAKAAKAMGGYSKENMFKAALGSVNMPDRDTSAAGFRGDPTKQFGGWH